MRALVRWLASVMLLCVWSGCSCDENAEIVADGYVRCHLAPPPEGERHHGSLTLRFVERELTIEGLPERPRLAVGSGPLGDVAPPDADLLIVLGDLANEAVPETDALVILLAGGTDDWQNWSEGIGAEREGVVDATPLRRITAGSLELIPVPGGPPRYVGGDGCCGLTEADAEHWQNEPAAAGTHRVLLSWAAPAAVGLLGLPVESPPVLAIQAEAAAPQTLFAWPRLDPRSVLPVSGPWVTRANGSREPPGWTVYEVGEEGLTRRSDSP